MLLLPLLLAGCGLWPSTVSYPEDTGEAWVVPTEYTDPSRLQVGTFNADWLWAGYEAGYYPRNAVDYAMVARLFADFDLEVVALQEVNGDAAMELLALEDHWSWTLGSSGWSQNPGLLWRNDRVSVDNVREIALDCNEWPSKDPLVADVTALDGSLAFTVVVVHSKPYAGNEDAEQRYTQAEQLHAWIIDELALEEERAPFNDNVLVLGDFNDAFTPLNPTWPSLAVFEDDPWFSFLTREAEDYSQISYRSLIDHLVVSEPLLEAWQRPEEGAGCAIIAHDEIAPWSNYDGGFGGGQNISDHRPVWAYFGVE
jgi:endonuclease/exonuclease/phosphatase family metal-dependent hydrolase